MTLCLPVVFRNPAKPRTVARSESGKKPGIGFAPHPAAHHRLTLLRRGERRRLSVPTTDFELAADDAELVEELFGLRDGVAGRGQEVV